MKKRRQLNYNEHDNMEAGVDPALCLSNRDINERVCGNAKRHCSMMLWEGIQVGHTKVW